MILVNPSFEVLAVTTLPLQLVELAGRTCYKSEGNISVNSAKQFAETLLRHGHESVIEHASATLKLTCDRGVTHELVRHRLASYSQESTRYCNYKGGITFVIPPWVDIVPGEYQSSRLIIYADDVWFWSMLQAETWYLHLLSMGWTPQQARSVLPNSLKTEIVVTANLREWRHILKLRTSKAAHPQMRELMLPILAYFKREVPELFNDIGGADA
jgi:thymidylate synthase (FAD)